MADQKKPKGRSKAAGKTSRKKAGVVHNTSRTNLLDAFRDTVLNDREVQDALRRVNTANDAVRLAAKYGFGITEDDVIAMQARSPVQLSLPELELIAGAAPCWCDPSVVDSKSCK